MQRLNRPTTFLAVLALVAASTLALSGAFAGDDVSAKPAAPTGAVDMPSGKAEMSVTKTPSPIHSMMGWMATAVVGDLDSPCPSCPKAESAWRGWFDGGKDVPLAALRDRLVADGWTADRYIGYFQKMSKAHAKEGGDCGSCDKDCGDCPSKGDCDKASGECCGSCDKDCGDCPSKADCGKDCGDCPSKADCGDCPSKGDCDKAEKGCGGCGSEKTAKPEPQGTAAK